jgi:phosphatidylinositol alpha 1,6-mannosyltransferase
VAGSSGSTRDGDRVRIAIVTESFLPQVNGVTNSVLRVCEQLQFRGHQTLVVAPGPGPTSYAGATVVRTPSLPLPGYRDFRLARPWPGLSRTLHDFAPDVVHLASPAALGAQAAYTARRLRLPVVAVYQTDLAGFAGRYGLGGCEQAVWRWLRRVHGLARRTLAPSRHAVAELRRHGVHRVDRWARGVDLQRFSPTRADGDLRRRLAPGGELLVGYVGRLAQEKESGCWRGCATPPGCSSSSSVTVPADLRSRRSCRECRSSGSRAGSSWRRPSPRSTSSCTPARTRPSARQPRRRWPARPSWRPAAGPARPRAARPTAALRARSVRAPAAVHGWQRPPARDPWPRPPGVVADRTWDVIGDQLVRHYRGGPRGTRSAQAPRGTASVAQGQLRHATLRRAATAMGGSPRATPPPARGGAGRARRAGPVTQHAVGPEVQLRGPELPGHRLPGAHRAARVTTALALLEPDRVEVHDRTTLRGVGRWAQRAGVPSLVVSHERLDRWLRQWLSPACPLDRVADRSNTALAAAFGTVVCTTAWAEQEFGRLGTPNLRRIPLGVDLHAFRPVEPAAEAMVRCSW